jgi:hypothetical protein
LAEPIVIIGAMSTETANTARMAFVEAALPSNRLAAAAAAERARLERDARRLERRAEALTIELEKLIAGREEIRHQLALLDQLAPAANPAKAPVEPQGIRRVALATDSEPANGYLSGARIRAVAVRLLAASEAGARPIHYQAWYELVIRAGFGITARDPLGTFLTQISRSPIVQKAEGPGFYRLDIEAPRQLQTTLRRLQE